jgi:chorismate mutase
MSEMLEKILVWFPEDDILKADGFDDAIIGIDDASMRLIYSVDKCIRILIDVEGMTEEDAVEYFHYNTKCAWVGEQTPIWCTDDL